MKTISNLSGKFALLLLAISFAFASCDKKDNDNNTASGMYTVSGNARGSQMVPSNTTSGTGTFTGTYNANTNLLNYNMAWTGLTGVASNAAFYAGTSGVNGTLIGNTTITTSGSTGASVGTMTLTDAQEQALLNGTMYYIVSTPTYASGEIRGQLTATVQ